MIVLLNMYICAEYIFVYLSGAEYTSSSWGHSKIYIPGTIANPQTDRAPTEINTNGVVVKERTRDTTRHLRVISNEIPVLLIL